MPEVIVYTSAGVLILGAAWAPLFLKNIPISVPMVALVAGLALAWPFTLDHPLVQHTWWVEHITSTALLVSVMGAGLRLDRPFSFHRWGGIWRLLGIVMPISIVMIGLVAHWLLALPIPVAALVASIIAPTDPVLAEAVKVGPPASGDDSDARFNLTAEAGLNDGLAFPFVILALTLVSRHDFAASDFGWWLLQELLWAPVAGACSGVAFGWALVWVNRRLPEDKRLSTTESGFVALGLSLLAYGLAEWIEGNGFVAVFVLAVTIRGSVRQTDYPRQLDHFLSEMEQIVMVVVIALFGLSIGNGLLNGMGPREILFALIVLLIVRPIVAWFGLLGSGLKFRTRVAISYFGIRGLGSLFYLTYVLEQRSGELPTTVLSSVGMVVLASVLLYGISSDAVVRRLRLSEDRVSVDRE